MQQITEEEAAVREEDLIRRLKEGRARQGPGG